MTDARTQIEKLLEQVRQERDELRVRAHLAKAELSEEWEKIEAGLGNLEAKAKELKQATAEAAGEIAPAAQLLAEQVRKGFETIRKHL